MSNHSISASQLTENTTVFIRGKLAFGRLTRPIDGDELARSDQRKIQSGMSPVGRPHTTVTITEAEVQFADPANPTIEERYVDERRYTSTKNPGTGANYSIDSKGSNLPIIAIPAAAGDGTFDQDTSGQELAQGLDVELVLRVYKPEKFANRGLSLSQVIVHEKPRYYNAGGVATSELAARGIVFNTPPRALQPPADASTSGVSETVGTEIKDGRPMPAPRPTAATRPQAGVPDTATVVPEQAEETPEQKLERLERENAALKNAGSAVGSPVGVGAGTAGTRGAGDPPASAGDQQAGITYQG
ncbi:hypothetical protein [Amycolatopsis sp. TNS106]|uniref:hypothetical protein n=1 Tax=Amycolatopsis sp. TNS106 TaxID=2861750 RepID=UPI001C58F4B9|nr:hypothetical protein [Amycolatopsis sp. TNS106]QXV57408.1 hypothetical protein CVV72_10655 [Amycolatopsis sp. TNS106]